jgi:hypothetical protein
MLSLADPTHTSNFARLWGCGLRGAAGFGLRKRLEWAKMRIVL